MPMKNLSVKFEEDVIEQLKKEAEERDQSQSEYVRKIIDKRGANIEEQLEEQGLTKEDRRELENQIEQLQQNNQDLKTEVAQLQDRNEALKGGLAEDHADILHSKLSDIHKSFNDQLNKLNERDKQLREQNEQLRESLEDTAETIDSLDFVTAQEFQNRNRALHENIDDTKEKLIREMDQSQTYLAGAVQSETEDLEDEVRHSRSPLTKLADWIRARVGQR